MKSALISALVLILVGLGGYYLLSQERDPARVVSSFTECEAAGYPVGESYPRQCWSPDGKNFVEEIESEPDRPAATSTLDQISGQVSMTGEITCLPKKGTGPQTLECAIGLKASDGKHYALRNLFNFDPNYQFSRTGMKVSVSGMLIAPEAGITYDIAGVIDLTSIREVN